MTEYAEITLRYAKESCGEKLRGSEGTAHADFDTGMLRIWDAGRGHIIIEPEHFDGFLDALLEVKKQREARAK